MLNRIAAFASAHPRRLAAAVAVAFVIALAFGSSASNVLNAHNEFSDPSSASSQATRQLERATGRQPAPVVLALVSGDGGATAHAAALLRSDPGVASVAAPVSSGTGDSSLLSVTLRAGIDEREDVEHMRRQFAGSSDVKLGGVAIAGREVGIQAASDLGLAELLAFPLLALLAFLIFRGIAALLPLAVGASSVFGAFAGLRLVNTALPLSVFALNLVIGLGLGLAVDYSLFMVSRFREELGAGQEVAGAVRATMNTAGRTVLYSAVTVALAMGSLAVFPLRFLQSMGIGGAIVALCAAAAALTVLPALFVLFGSRLGRTVPGRAEDGRWYAFARAVLRRPGAVAAATALALVLVALPALRTQWSGVDARVLPASSSAHQVETALQREYPSVPPAPGYVAVRAGAGSGAAVSGYAQSLRAVPGVASVAVPAYVGDGTWLVSFQTAGEAIASSAQRSIADMRAVRTALGTAIGGSGAEFADQRSAIAGAMPAALLILVSGTLIVLWLMTGSVILPVKALLMNTLTVGAATGLLVLIFQDGRLQGLLSYTPQRGIQESNYFVLAAIAFALSTDYGVFLLTRIKEAHDAGKDDNEAIALGVQRTGRIVTAAAVLLAVALGAFATSSVVFLKEIGIGAVVAVLLDAFVVRLLLVPALMSLLGSWNWWSPRPLRRLHERIELSEGGAPLARSGASA